MPLPSLQLGRDIADQIAADSTNYWKLSDDEKAAYNRFAKLAKRRALGGRYPHSGGSSSIMEGRCRRRKSYGYTMDSKANLYTLS